MSFTPTKEKKCFKAYDDFLLAVGFDNGLIQIYFFKEIIETKEKWDSLNLYFTAKNSISINDLI